MLHLVGAISVARPQLTALLTPRPRFPPDAPLVAPRYSVPAPAILCRPGFPYASSIEGPLSLVEDALLAPLTSPTDGQYDSSLPLSSPLSPSASVACYPLQPSLFPRPPPQFCVPLAAPGCIMGSWAVLVPLCGSAYKVPPPAGVDYRKALRFYTGVRTCNLCTGAGSFVSHRLGWKGRASNMLNYGYSCSTNQPVDRPFLWTYL